MLVAFMNDSVMNTKQEQLLTTTLNTFPQEIQLLNTKVIYPSFQMAIV